MNHVVDMKTIQECGQRFNKEMKELDNVQSEMRTKGTAHLTNIMNDYDLLPTHNFKFGSHPDAKYIHSDIFKEKYFTQGMFDGCWMGCNMSCCKAVDAYELKTGPYKGQKVCVDGPEYETVGALGSDCGIFDPDHIIEANFYADTYGIDTISLGNLIAFAMECYENGIINDEITGGLQLKFGNKEAAMELIHQIACGEGFGKIAGMGVRKMRQYFVKEYGADAQFLRDTVWKIKVWNISQYVSKESLAQQGGYAMTNKGPQHDEAWLISWIW
jgi:aldehyde:ferredoxin oxidoreductase